jgi:hypothetical protein
MSIDGFDEGSPNRSRDTWHVWADRLLATFTDAKDALGREAAYHVLLLMAVQQLRRLKPLVDAGWRGDEPEPEEHFEAIRRLCSEIAKAGQVVPASEAPGRAQDEEEGG